MRSRWWARPSDGGSRRRTSGGWSRKRTGAGSRARSARCCGGKGCIPPPWRRGGRPGRAGSWPEGTQRRGPKPKRSRPSLKRILQTGTRGAAAAAPGGTGGGLGGGPKKTLGLPAPGRRAEHRGALMQTVADLGSTGIARQHADRVAAPEQQVGDEESRSPGSSNYEYSLGLVHASLPPRGLTDWA